MNRFLRLMSATCCVLFLVAMPRVDGATKTYDFQRKVLDNGLTIVSLEDHSCPIVAVQVWYHVGSKDEDPERQGFAHMFEHMMFRGTDRLGPEDHFEHIRRTGGDCNAYTAFDNTTYVNELPSNQLELALWLEAERMAFLKIDDESFYKERAVVEEERRMSSLNTPYGTVPEKLLPVLFTKHPYRWTPIGQIPHLRAATIDELQAFWDRFYTPSNATLVVVGDVKHADVQRLAAKYFSWIPKIPPAEQKAAPEPAQSEARSINIPEKKGPVPIVGYMYRGVPENHPDEIALGMLMSILGGGESSRLYKDIVKEKQVAQVAVAGAFSLEDDGLAGAGAVLMPWGDKQKVLDIIQEHVKKIREEPVTQRELDKVKNQLLSAEVTKLLTVAGKAQTLGQFQVFENDADKANDQLARIRAVTTDDLLRVAKEYLKPERETKVVVQPEYGGFLKGLFGGKDGDVDEGATPAVKPAENRIAKRGGLRADLQRPADFPTQPPMATLLESVPQVAQESVTLSNGLKVVVVPNHEVPFVTMTFGILNGAWTEEKPGTASLAAGLVTKGTDKHSAAELAEELEFNAISLSGDASLDAASVNVSCVTDKYELAAKLLSEVVRTPTFPEKELDILRQQTLLGLMVQSKTPEYSADKELRQRMFGAHPYSRTDTGEPTDVQALSAGDVKKWWKTFVRPDSCVLYVAGDVDPAKAQKLAKELFEDWKADGPKPEVKLPPIPQPSASHIYLVDRPGSVQSQIRIGHVGITRSDPAYFNSVVISQIFGGSFGSRLNKAIRVDKGLTYGARGGFSASRFAGTFKVSTFTKNPSTGETMDVIIKELEKITSAAPEKDEVDLARSYLVGSFAGDRETPQSTVRDLWLIDYAGLPKDYFTKFLGGVKDATPESAFAAAKRLIQRDKLTIVVVGEGDAIKADLEKIAPVTVIKETPDEMKAPTEPEKKPGA